jgi:hypothetical protein
MAGTELWMIAVTLSCSPSVIPAELEEYYEEDASEDDGVSKYGLEL